MGVQKAAKSLLSQEQSPDGLRLTNYVFNRLEKEIVSEAYKANIGRLTSRGGRNDQ